MGMGILDPEQQFLQQWNKKFMLSCVISLFLDPLFFYISVIDGRYKCLDLDTPLGITLCILRSLIDIFYLLHIFFQFNTGFVAPSSQAFGSLVLIADRIAIAKRYLSTYFIIDILSILPLAQLVVLVITVNKNRSFSPLTRDVLKFVVLCQYIPRLIRIRPLFKEVKSISGIHSESAWAGAAVNLLFFMLASHVVGAIWYLISIERKLSCWHDTCKGDENCKLDYLYCGEHLRQLNDFLSASCPLLERNEIKDTTDFDFGIFLDALQSKVVEMRDFPRKLFYCFWWGFRNLSSLGQNLNTSTSLWEVLFAIFISVLGLVLFSLFIGNMQKYLQTMISISVREEEMRLKRQETEQWMSHCMLPEDLRERIRRSEKLKWKTTRGVEQELFIQNLPKDLRRDVKRHLCLSFLMRVPMFAYMDGEILDALCNRLKLVSYAESSYLIREGDPVEEMLFFKRGKVESVTTNGSCGRDGFFSRYFLGTGDFCGEELFTWALDARSSSFLPVSTRTLRSILDVEAFALTADDLKFVASQFPRMHSKQVQHIFRFYSQQWRTWAACFIQTAWRRYCMRKLEKYLREAENRHLNTLTMEGGTTTPGLGAAIYASRFATNSLRSLRRNQATRKLPTLLLQQQPPEPDYNALKSKIQ